MANKAKGYLVNAKISIGFKSTHISPPLALISIIFLIATPQKRIST